MKREERVIKMKEGGQKSKKSYERQWHIIVCEKEEIRRGGVNANY